MVSQDTTVPLPAQKGITCQKQSRFSPTAPGTASRSTATRTACWKAPMSSSCTTTSPATTPSNRSPSPVRASAWRWMQIAIPCRSPNTCTASAIRITPSSNCSAEPSAPASSPVSCAAIGVWDTVGSLGIPVYDATEDKRLDLFRFADADLSGKVAQGFHALAIDEHRADFTPTPWNARSGIEQVWFAGAHADVGGGYEESGLSDFGLAWMADRLGTVGLQYKDPLPLLPAGDVSGELHDSWNALPYKLKPAYLRPIAPDAQVHRSVQQRRAALAAYQPGNLVNWAGQYVQ